MSKWIHPILFFALIFVLWDIKLYPWEVWAVGVLAAGNGFIALVDLIAYFGHKGSIKFNG